MSARDRLIIFPSRANHVFLKQRHASAIKGLNLLKRKRDALELKLREITFELRQCTSILNESVRDAIFTITKANYLCTDFKPASVMAVDHADVYLTINFNKVVGVMLPIFNMTVRNSTSFPLTGLAHGGLQVQIIRWKFRELLTLLISMASMKYASKVLLEAVRQNNMRVNGLEFVVIPRIHNTINYIRDELDEFEREDFYRLKRSQANQRKAKEKFNQLVEGKKGALLVPLPESVDHPFDLDTFDQPTERPENVRKKKRVTLQTEPGEEEEQADGNGERPERNSLAE